MTEEGELKIEDNIGGKLARCFGKPLGNQNLMKWPTVASFVLSALFLLHYFPFVQVRENSMRPALEPGTLLILNRLSYIWGDIQAGDILVFGSSRIKRSVLVPQMPLRWQGLRLYIPYWETYVQVRPEVYQSLAGLERMPADSIFVLGDNRSHSVDSRRYGLVSIAQVQGKVLGAIPAERINKRA